MTHLFMISFSFLVQTINNNASHVHDFNLFICLSALVPTTNNNASHVQHPPYREDPPAPAKPNCTLPLQGAAALWYGRGADERILDNLTK